MLKLWFPIFSLDRRLMEVWRGGGEGTRPMRKTGKRTDTAVDFPKRPVAVAIYNAKSFSIRYVWQPCLFARLVILIYAPLPLPSSSSSSSSHLNRFSGYIFYAFVIEDARVRFLTWGKTFSIIFRLPFLSFFPFGCVVLVIRGTPLLWLFVRAPGEGGGRIVNNRTEFLCRHLVFRGNGLQFIERISQRCLSACWWKIFGLLDKYVFMMQTSPLRLTMSTHRISTHGINNTIFAIVFAI